jgi:hypothetical protein
MEDATNYDTHYHVLCGEDGNCFVVTLDAHTCAFSICTFVALMAVIVVMGMTFVTSDLRQQIL